MQIVRSSHFLIGIHIVQFIVTVLQFLTRHHQLSHMMKSSNFWLNNRIPVSTVLMILTFSGSYRWVRCKTLNTNGATAGIKNLVSSFGDNQWTPIRDYKSQEASQANNNNKAETMKAGESQIRLQSSLQDRNIPRAVNNYAKSSEEEDDDSETSVKAIEVPQGRESVPLDSVLPLQNNRKLQQPPQIEEVEEAESGPEAEDQEPDQQGPEAEKDESQKEQEAAEASEAEAADRSALDEQQQAQREIILAQAQSEARAIKEQQESLLRQTKLQQQMLLRRNHELESNHSDMRQQSQSRKGERRRNKPSQLQRDQSQVQRYPVRQQQYSPRPHQQSDIQFSDQPDRTNPRDKNAINQEEEMSDYSERQPSHSQPPDENELAKKNSADLLPAAQHHYGSHYGTLHGHHKDYYMYAESHKKGQYDSGYKRGGKKFHISGHSSQHKSHAEGHVKWKGKKGKGTHYWAYKHKDKKGHHHHY